MSASVPSGEEEACDSDSSKTQFLFEQTVCEAIRCTHHVVWWPVNVWRRVDWDFRILAYKISLFVFAEV